MRWLEDCCAVLALCWAAFGFVGFYREPPELSEGADGGFAARALSFFPIETVETFSPNY